KANSHNRCGVDGQQLFQNAGHREKPPRCRLAHSTRSTLSSTRALPRLVQFMQILNSSGGLHMKGFLSLGTGIVCAVLVAGSIQASQEKKKADEVVTVTGCLEKGDDANTFKLTHTADTAGVATKA